MPRSLPSPPLKRGVTLALRQRLGNVAESRLKLKIYLSGSKMAVEAHFTMYVVMPSSLLDWVFFSWAIASEISDKDSELRSKTGV